MSDLAVELQREARIASATGNHMIMINADYFYKMLFEPDVDLEVVRKEWETRYRKYS